ncbi:hypothetical protein TIFTF001_035839 [Ficus carica]|uniref:Uncharacterized protein n=1 Tax=Ficus carica TaxID=3494 RepID=A0AA88JC52_FICCA|nr:hypothetical protein TIFTF001_035839 [Ficus carica]
MKGNELFIVKRYDDVHTCSIEIVQGHHHQAKSWMIGECVKGEMVKRKSPGSDIYIETDSGKSLKYFYMFAGLLLAACGHDADDSIFPLAFNIVPHKGIEYAANIVYPDANFGIWVQHLTANLKTRYKGFKGPMKTYFDGASRAYLVSKHHYHMESIRNRNLDMHRYLLQAYPKKWSRAYFNRRRYAIMTTNIIESLNSVDRKPKLMPVGFLVEWLRELLQRSFVDKRIEALKLTSKLAPKAKKLLRTKFSLGLIPRPADQFEYAVTNKTAQTWIVDMRGKT